MSDDGDSRASASDILPGVYAQLRKLAAFHLSRLRAGQSLQPTALVHEAYLQLVGNRDPGWNSRGHFFGAAAQAMRQIVVHHLRRRMARKRGGGERPSPLDTSIAVAGGGFSPEDALAVDQALGHLEAQHPRPAQVVVMRYFGGMSVDEIAEALGVTPRTVERDWRFAAAFLQDVLAGPPGDAP